MTREEFFYDRLKREYDEYMETIREWDSDELIKNSEYIGDYMRIYEYLMRDKPISENSYLEFYERLKNPLEMICERYQEDKPPMHDLVNNTIWDLGREHLPDESYSEIKLKFLQKVADNYHDPSNNSLPVNVRNLQLFMHEYIRCHIEYASDDDLKVLMQFKNPLRVLMESKPIDNARFELRISETAQYIMNRDVTTMPYELDPYYLMSETKFRHNAINSINNIVLVPEFNVTMNWLELCRDVASEDEDIQNPYLELINAFTTVFDEQGANTLQELYLMGREHCILPNEVIEAGKYLADGGKIELVHKLAEYGYFECPYEDNHSAEEFLATIEEHQGGMTMM